MIPSPPARFSTRVPIRTVADHAKDRVDAFVAQPAEALEHDVGPLYGGHPTDPTDHESLVCDSHHPPGLGTGRAVGGEALVELDAQTDDAKLRGRRDSEGDELVAYLRAHRNQYVRDPGEHPFEQAEDTRPEPAEVAAQHVAVEGVHDDRRPAAACEQRGNAADGASLGRVRVEDRGSFGADDAGKADRREQVADG
jgi:hypothetical protein